MSAINLIVVPFHDYKIALYEGFRTRDTHLYQHFMSDNSIDKLVIINRPTSLIELILRKKKLLTNANVVYNKNRCYIQKIKKNVFVIDIFSTDILNVARLKHAWLPIIYSSSSTIRKIKSALSFLGIHNHAIYMSSPFSVKLALQLESKIKILDAVDNLAKHKLFAYFKDEIDQLYNIAKSSFDIIFVNSTDTLNYLNIGCHCQLVLLENGVDIEIFRKEHAPLPNDLLNIQKPIVGYAGKMQSMFDVDLLKKITAQYPNVSFVLIGKILDAEWMKDIHTISNVYYLGDKKYNILPDYINNFDICFIPYIIQNQHGGDPIKFYEFMACNLPIISMNIGQIKKYHNAKSIFICDTHEEFIRHMGTLLTSSFDNIFYDLETSFSWKDKAKQIISKIKEIQRC